MPPFTANALLIAAVVFLIPAGLAQAMNRAPVRGGELECEVRGDGEPVLLIHGGHVAASFLPLMDEPALASYRLIRYRWRRRAATGPRRARCSAILASGTSAHLGKQYLP